MSAPSMESSGLDLFLFSLISISSLLSQPLEDRSLLLTPLWVGAGVTSRAYDTDCLIADEVLLKKVRRVGWLEDEEGGAGGLGFGVMGVGEDELYQMFVFCQ
jgi:hypothetical protein